MDIGDRLYKGLESSLDLGIANGVFPSAVAGICIGDQEPMIITKNQALDTVFDLASLTKVTATSPAVLLAVQLGKAGFSDPVTEWVPEFSSPHDLRREQVTLFHLLTHTSGLPAWRPYFIRLKGKQEYLTAICNEPLANSPDSEIVYSDLGFMLLGFILERIWGMDLEQVISSLVLKELGLHRTCYLPEAANGQAAPTEEGNQFEKQMALHYAENFENGKLIEGAFGLSKANVENFKWRNGLISGSVHDCNAHYGLHGVSGHAGLFSDIKDMFRYMELWREGSRSFLSAQIKQKATQPLVSSSGLSRGIGWEIYSTNTFGHTGFTGTSVWHNSSNRVTCLILTNRVHPTVRSGIQEWRQQTRDQLISTLIS
jgi:serine-type D-Ala-D-Ala carboxypeptidase